MVMVLVIMVVQLQVLHNNFKWCILADTHGTGGSGTAINLASNRFSNSAGTIAVGNELITYTGISSKI